MSPVVSYFFWQWLALRQPRNEGLCIPCLGPVPTAWERLSFKFLKPLSLSPSAIEPSVPWQPGHMFVHSKVNGDRGRVQLPNAISALKLSKSVLALVIPPGSRRFGHLPNIQIET